MLHPLQPEHPQAISVSSTAVVSNGHGQSQSIRLLFLGPPGAGKGTQAQILATTSSRVHISTGAILRDAVAQQTMLGQMAQSYIAQGQLVPDSLILELVRTCFSSMNIRSGWILDGFPRTLVQAQFLDLLLKDVHQPLDWAVNFDVPDEVLVTRLLNRGRSDDQEIIIRQRLEVYRMQTIPLIEFYRDRQQLISINGNQTVSAIATQLQQELSLC